MTQPPAHRSRRILLTGLSTYWGGRLAQALERFDEVEAIIGVDSADPTRELERTEFVRVGNEHALIQRIVQAAEIDTVIDTRLVVDSITTAPRLAHENNVIGTMNILTACAGADSPVRKVVFKGSAHYYGCEQDDPAFFTEEMRRPRPPRTPIEKDIVEAESSVAEFAQKHPEKLVTVLRFANVLGPHLRTSHVRLFSLPVVPMILGFDPRYQFVHEDDVVHALEHAVLNSLHGVFNIAADGVLVLSEVIDLLGKRSLPVLPPWGTGAIAGPLRRLGFRIPDEMLNQMRFGRALDNRRFKATGFSYQHTARETALKLREHMRLSSIVKGTGEGYRYEREVEEFLRWSPYVTRPPGEGEGEGFELTRRQVSEIKRVMGLSESRSVQRLGARPPMPEDAGAGGGAAAGEASQPRIVEPSEQVVLDPDLPVADYDDLEGEEVIALLGVLERADLEAVERHERAGRARPRVLAAIEQMLE